MPWTTPDTRTPGDVLSASAHNTYIRDNLLYVHSGKPLAALARNNGGPYSAVAAAGWAAIDPTHLAVTLTLSTGRALITFTGNVYASIGLHLSLDVDIDGARLGGADGIARVYADSTTRPVSFAVLRAGLTEGAHTFTLVWKASADTAYLHADSTLLAHFAVAEW